MPTSEQSALLAICKLNIVDWHLVAREAQRPGGLDRLTEGRFTEASPEAHEAGLMLKRHLDDLDKATAEVIEGIQPALDSGAQLTTVLDGDYPASLRTIFNLPPFLFYRGEMLDQDAHAVAVVGTRQPSPEGLDLAREIARELTERGVTVVSGLAAGIDTAAHRSALEAGGRTVAVFGTGINRVYPKDNVELSERIIEHGAIVSQFWPDQAPATYTFPRRNVVTSGLSQGTVVVEASATSGAKMQARLAHQHGKKVFLVKRLVTEQEWARRYVEKKKAIEVSSVDDIMRLMRPASVVRERSAQVYQEALQL